MTNQEESAVLEAVTAILIEHGPAAKASAYSIIMNCAVQIEREQTLKAESHQRTHPGVFRPSWYSGWATDTVSSCLVRRRIDLSEAACAPAISWSLMVSDMAASLLDLRTRTSNAAGASGHGVVGKTGGGLPI